MSKKLTILGSNRKIGGVPSFGGKRSCLKRIGVTTQVRTEVEVGTLLLSSDKNSVIAGNVLSYSSCFSSKFEVEFTRFETKQ